MLRLIINPFNDGRWPYYIIPYEIQPYTIYGIGVSETMADTQMLMNGFMRMAVDNAALSSNVMLEVNETQLVPGQSMDVYPGKKLVANADGWKKLRAAMSTCCLAESTPGISGNNKPRSFPDSSSTITP